MFIPYCILHNNTGRTLDVVFLKFKGFSFAISLRQRPKGVTFPEYRLLIYILVFKMLIITSITSYKL